MMSLKAFLNERLLAVADEIFGAVEKTIDEYKEEICRMKDLEIGRLRMQLRLLKPDPLIGVQLQEHTRYPLPPPPPLSPPPPPPPQQQQNDAAADMEAPHSAEEASSSNLEQPREPARVKTEPHRNHKEFWLGHSSEEQLEDLESDIKDFMSSASNVKNSLQDFPSLPFYLYHNNIGEEAKEKPYSCSVCEKRFANCSHLAAHIRTHTGERPYRCDICRKSFVTTSALNRHQTIHTEGKHYVCIYCSKAFKWMESLGRHVRIAHKRLNVPE
uniref:zinc finger protein 431-like n=1 Tax=Doryrhamphus excisus TaxID=161450 RepID=UPI0025ADD7F6|nr:zinc finger protein 431-like [Doryrhamphus excisus]XP_057909702.1 zinc finger protein 431-like [Doryrhamphus excisus]XP_057909703.1 zinc finger protein 431-like [Doryrhamphus excisus]XP_057909704.1 zinc finger protein 431-like [Doryrhamphus excisus]